MAVPEVATTPQFVPSESTGSSTTPTRTLQACYDHLLERHQRSRISSPRCGGHVAERLADQPAIIGFDPTERAALGLARRADVRGRQAPADVRARDHRRARARRRGSCSPSRRRRATSGLASRLAPFDVPDVVYAPHMYDASAELNGTFDESIARSLMSTATDLRADADRLGLPAVDRRVRDRREDRRGVRRTVW